MNFPEIQAPKLPDVPPFPGTEGLQNPQARRRVVLASHNAGKLAELQRLVDAAGVGVQLVSLAEVGATEAPDETGATFEENALIKARAAHRATGFAALADDSGLAVDALNGMPGIRSARWAGPGRDDQANNDLLLAQLDDLPEGARRAQFVCAMALVAEDGSEQVRLGEWPGQVALSPRGSNGFGYDPIFCPEGSDQTSAELDPAQKDAQSHRARAVAAILPLLARAPAGDSTGDGTAGDSTH